MTRFIAVFLIVALFTAPLAFAAKDGKRSDDEIYNDVRRKLANDPDVQGAEFQVDVQNGMVTIKGIVEKDKLKAKAERLARKVKGVTGVNNQLKVGPKASLR
jgi:osmotically-inducible protein OsmY